MPTIFTHAVVPLPVGIACDTRRLPPKLIAAAGFALRRAVSSRP